MKKILSALALGTAAFISSASAQTILIDFGSGNATLGGFLTVSDTSNGPDSNGNYWNNYFVNGSTLNSMVFTNNSSSGISMSGVGTTTGAATGGWGVGNGTVSLANNNLNIYTAYTDGIYVFGGSSTLTFTGLDSSKFYSFEVFGSRSSSTTSRTTLYTFTSGSGVTTRTLLTSGPGIGGNGTANFNTSNTISANNLVPDGSNQISLKFEGNLGQVDGSYINAIQITVVPEPTTNALLFLAALAGSWLSFRRKSKVSN